MQFARNKPIEKKLFQNVETTSQLVKNLQTEATAVHPETGC